VNKANPTLAWATPAAITYGTPLSGTQLDATATGVTGATLPGTFTYTPPLGTVLQAGLQTLSVSFVPTDIIDYTTPATTTVQLQVNKANPTLAWATPAAITYGTPLSATQLNATATGVTGATLPGTFTYTPPSGTVLQAGLQTLSVSFVPTDTTDYTSPATTTVQLQVNKANPTLTWATPAAITYGTPLSATQLNATATGVTGATLPGTFTYTPPSGTVLQAGLQTLSVSFVPTDTTDYTSPATATVQLQVNKANPILTWATPAAITYGTALSGTQLDATATGVNEATLPGIFTYTPPSGTVLTAGAQTLSVSFVPTDTTDYTSPATTTVQLQVNKANPILTWATPAPITYGTPLSGTQLDATSSVPGSFSYSPPQGTVLTAGQHTLSVTFTPTDTTDYSTSSTSVSLTVTMVTPLIALTSSANPVFTSNPLTFTATFTVPAASPTGIVTFLDGTTPLGSGAVTANVATLTIPAPAVGIHSITAVYSGDTNYLAAASPILSEIVQDFTIALSPGAAGTVTAPFGGQADYPLVITSLGGATLPAAVSLTLTGLPPGMTALFTPPVVAAGTSTTNLTLQVFMPGYAALQPPPSPFGGRSLPLALGLILLPFAGRLRKTSHRFLRVAVLALAGAALAVGLNGCQITFTPKSFPLTVTATSGTLSHTTTVNIIVQ
jgi:hypothetical protein